MTKFDAMGMDNEQKLNEIIKRAKVIQAASLLYGAKGLEFYKTVKSAMKRKASDEELKKLMEEIAGEAVRKQLKEYGIMVEELNA
ncbi:MAG: hypothetical protein QXU11_00670 [Thermoproteota archaeon]